MEEKYAFLLDEEDRKELIDTAKKTLNLGYEDGASFVDHMPVASSTISKHRTGYYNVMGPELFFALYNAVNRSSARYDLDNPEIYIESVDMDDRLNWRNEEGVLVKDKEDAVNRIEFPEDRSNFLKYLTTHHELEELESMFSVSKDQFRFWRNNDKDWVENGKRMPEDIFYGLTDEVRDIYGLDLSPDLVDQPGYRGQKELDDSVIIPSLTHDEIEVLQETQDVDTLMYERARKEKEITPLVNDIVPDQFDEVKEAFTLAFMDEDRDVIETVNGYLDDLRVSKTIERGDFTWLPDAERPYIWLTKGSRIPRYVIFRSKNRKVDPLSIDEAEKLGELETDDSIDSILSQAGTGSGQKASAR